ncbi:MAG: glucose-6-phosphate dehydrogenase [Desulfuromonadaceae bacterium]|nr:glucose-6-phosphate dehydrogenase [Desulfuromonadaceae bacterium]
MTENQNSSRFEKDAGNYRFCDARAVGQLEPCTIVIFGASGDLTSRKLLPALFRMYCAGGLPHPVTVVGCARSRMDNDKFRRYLKESAKQETDFDDHLWQEFAAHLHYFALNYDETSFRQLADHLRELDIVTGTGGNRLFHLAVPPSLYGTIGGLLGGAGLNRENIEGSGWARIVVEKPFGRDLVSAVQLDESLRRHFHEKQIFRIDHYLAKDTVQNVLMLRFANAVFEPLWNRNFIDHVGIIAAESLGIGKRAGYYEESGVIRDMFQNHMLQLLALTAMEPPSQFEAERVRDEKVKVLRSIRPFSLKPDDNLVLGQYGEGIVDGNAVTGYRREEGVDPQSLTPTFALMRLFVDNWRWKGVPFYLVSGKRLKSKVTSIVIQFREVPHTLFQNILAARIIANRLELWIYPEEGIRLSFQAKDPGPRLCLQTRTMDFNYRDNFAGPGFDPYAKMLLDAMAGNQMLFWRQDAVEASWELLTPILHDCEVCRGRATLLHPYPAGSWGPEGASAWVERIIGSGAEK